MGGIGKTQTAIEYAYRHWDDYDAIFWCSADSETNLNTAYNDIAIRLDLPQRDAQNPEVTNEAVKAWLTANTGYLLLFDNVDDPAILKQYLPVRPIGHILVTSRAYDFAILNIKGTIRLQKLPADEALTFLLQRTEKMDASKAEYIAAVDLALELGYLPLALEQAAAYIAHDELSFTDYLTSYRRFQIELLEKHGPVTGDYPETVRTTWHKSFAAVREKSEAAAKLLTISAFFAPDAIPYELILKGASKLDDLFAASLASEDIINLLEILTILADYSLIHRDAKKHTYDIHRMMQAVQCEILNEQRGEWAERAIRAVNIVFPTVEFTNWSQCTLLLPHALACLHHASVNRHRICRFTANSPGVTLPMRVKRCRMTQKHTKT